MKLPRPRLFSVIIVMILLFTAAGSLFSGAFLRGRADDRAAFKEQIIDVAVQSCLSRTVDRQNDRDMWLFIMGLSADRAVDDRQASFLEYLNEAKDELDCDFNSATFGQDIDPPDSGVGPPIPSG